MPQEEVLTITHSLISLFINVVSGKTTLLSSLSLRLDPARMQITGEVRLNSREYSRKALKAMSAYVMQVSVYFLQQKQFININS